MRYYKKFKLTCLIAEVHGVRIEKEWYSARLINKINNKLERICYVKNMKVLSARRTRIDSLTNNGYGVASVGRNSDKALFAFIKN